jgi:3-hydroxy-9,10-secoandrosta-1,3,5(10)-triene-9,17-dione monooxygenase reductase component
MNSPAITNSQQFRRALGTFATGVTIVTTRDSAAQDIGLTASSFNSVSLNPPMVLWSLARQSLSLPAFLGAEHFAVHVLAATQDDLAQRFATRGADKFAGLLVERGPGDIPLLDGCAARFQCRTAYRYEGGDHVIFVGAVIAFDQFDRPPLVFHGGEYAITARKSGGVAAEPPSAGDSSFSSEFLIYLLGRAHYQLFLRLRRELDQHGLAEADWFVLSILSSEEQQSVAQLDARLAYTGSHVTYDQIALLAAAGFVKLHGAYYPGVPVSLTEAGRQAVIELVSAAKAAESDAERHLGYDETRVLKQWLRQIIDDSDPGPPATWRRNNRE